MVVFGRIFLFLAIINYVAGSFITLLLVLKYLSLKNKYGNHETGKIRKS